MGSWPEYTECELGESENYTVTTCGPIGNVGKESSTLRLLIWGRGFSYQIDSVEFSSDGSRGIPFGRTYAPEETCLANNPQAFAADPVNTRSGNFTHQEVDVSIPTRGLPLTFERSYNSLDTYAGVLGRGWTHNYNLRLVVDGDAVTLMAPRGSRLDFTDNGDSTFTAGPGVRAALVRNPDDSYTLTRGDQIVYTFDAAGRLTALTDSNGNTTTLTYTGDDLTTVTAPGGRSLSLAYDGQGRITQFTDPLNRTVSYAYDAAG